MYQPRRGGCSYFTYDWSNTFEMTQSSCEQNESWLFLSANPPVVSSPMLAEVPSDARVTLYSAPSYAAYSARTVLRAGADYVSHAIGVDR